MSEVGVNLAHYKPISTWKPRVGDVLVWHGWIQHWFGIVSGINKDGTLTVVKGGLPLLLVTQSGAQIESSKSEIPLGEIHSSTGGSYAAIQVVQDTPIWFV
jgi:hypothetical protein